MSTELPTPGQPVTDPTNPGPTDPGPTAVATAGPADPATSAGPGGPGGLRAPYVSPDPDVLHEHPAQARAGIPVLLGVLVLVVVVVASLVGASASALWFVLTVPAALLALLGLMGLYVLAPNQAAVLTLFGAYRGTDSENGLRFANPFYSASKVSLRVRNFTTTSSKVNDANGNPIRIAAVIVWRVVDTARAAFGVDDVVNYVHTQSESAVRHIARAYPYESFDDPDTTTLIGEPDEVNTRLRDELAERAAAAGVNILEVRVTDLSYSPEVAEAMLRRQQASAIVAGRFKIVEGAVSMVHLALKDLEAGGAGVEGVKLEGAQRAMFAANLMTVIVSDSPTTPVVNVSA